MARRIDVTSAKDALNGYQKGKCFYCFDDISVEPFSDNLADVDHFIPHMLSNHLPNINLDGIWNLVLACKTCNRGESGKFERIPTMELLERLHKRNEFFIDSLHPLRETLINQTGNTTAERILFLNGVRQRAKKLLIQEWKPKNQFEPLF